MGFVVHTNTPTTTTIHLLYDINQFVNKMCEAMHEQDVYGDVWRWVLIRVSAGCALDGETTNSYPFLVERKFASGRFRSIDNFWVKTVCTV